ncbi:acetyl-CoA synthetase-like protein [Linderina pennispora]|uniref:Acetyl-CoA synthetase-like protein n=1 Tax=Linderina pennispora TaxID=61395 RepID=A0A1Y1WNY5_9FUNG|nr:acetyl-CoA synthetase-like protein [Linderina pennispora]ORX74998.1 acetyl-CoA synthetase-like protein [Linderina pennispora]
MPTYFNPSSVHIPSVDLPSFFFDTVKNKTVFGRKPEIPFLISEQRTLSFAEFETFTYGLASGLSNNAGPEVRRLTLAAQMVGAAVCTANPLYTAHEIAHQIKLTDAKDEAINIAGSSIPDSLIFTLDGANSVFDILSDKSYPRVYLQTDDGVKNTVAFIVFSSGTSGFPKGVMLSHRNIVANILQMIGFEKADKVQTRRFAEIEEARMFSESCPSSTFTDWCASCTTSFALDAFCQNVQRYRCRTAHLVPPIILGLTKSPITAKYDLSSFIFVNSGSAPLTKELQQEAQKVLGFPMCHGYGLTEASPGICRPYIDDVVYGSSGRLVPNMQVKVIDSDGREVGPGKSGELCFAGPNIMMGYLNNPAATAETIDADGYLRTGDIGHVDNKGNIFITDRKKELIKYKGFQIAPAELEGLLLDHPAILDAAVIGVYADAQETEVPKGFVVLRPGTNTSGIVDEIHKWVNKRAIQYKKLRGGIEVVDAIPKSATGKILRRVLKERESQKSKQMKC